MAGHKATGVGVGRNGGVGVGVVPPPERQIAEVGVDCLHPFVQLLRKFVAVPQDPFAYDSYIKFPEQNVL